MFLMITHLLDDLNKFNQKPLSITTLTKSKISSAIHRPLRSIGGNHRLLSNTSTEVAENLHHNRDDDELEEYLTCEQVLSFYPRNIPDRHSLLLDYTLRSTSLLSINVHDAVICTIQYSTASRKLRDSE